MQIWRLRDKNVRPMSCKHLYMIVWSLLLGNLLWTGRRLFFLRGKTTNQNSAISHMAIKKSVWKNKFDAITERQMIGTMQFAASCSTLGRQTHRTYSLAGKRMPKERPTPGWNNNNPDYSGVFENQNQKNRVLLLPGFLSRWRTNPWSLARFLMMRMPLCNDSRKSLMRLRYAVGEKWSMPCGPCKREHQNTRSCIQPFVIFTFWFSRDTFINFQRQLIAGFEVLF